MHFFCTVLALFLNDAHSMLRSIMLDMKLGFFWMLLVGFKMKNVFYFWKVPLISNVLPRLISVYGMLRPMSIHNVVRMLSFGDLWSPNAIFSSPQFEMFKLESVDWWHIYLYIYIQLRCVIFAVPSQILCILGSAAKAQVSDSKERETVIYYYCQEKLTCVSLSKCLIALFRTF